MNKILKYYYIFELSTLQNKYYYFLFVNISGEKILNNNENFIKKQKDRFIKNIKKNYNISSYNIKLKDVLFFSGFKDRNNKEIIEGDIIKPHDLDLFSSDGLPQFSFVLFVNGCFISKSGEEMSFLFEKDVKELEKIGNIYLNTSKEEVDDYVNNVLINSLQKEDFEDYINDFKRKFNNIIL